MTGVKCWDSPLGYKDVEFLTESTQQISSFLFLYFFSIRAAKNVCYLKIKMPSQLQVVDHGGFSSIETYDVDVH